MREQIKIVCERVAAVIRAALGGAVSSRAGYAELARRSHPRAAATLFAKVIVRPRTEGQCAEFEAAVGQVPAILSAHRLSCSGDYLLELTQEYPVDLDRMKEDVLARLPGYVDCSIAVVDRTAVDPDAFLEAHAAAGAARLRRFTTPGADEPARLDRKRCGGGGPELINRLLATSRVDGKGD